MDCFLPSLPSSTPSFSSPCAFSFMIVLREIAQQRGGMNANRTRTLFGGQSGENSGGLLSSFCPCCFSSSSSSPPQLSPAPTSSQRSRIPESRSGSVSSISKSESGSQLSSGHILPNKNEAAAARDLWVHISDLVSFAKQWLTAPILEDVLFRFWVENVLPVRVLCSLLISS